jgi:methyl-accepting chemotaxis protein
VALRSESITVRATSRAALGAGFLAVGVAAFLQGSLLVDDRTDARLIGLRAAGVLALLVGSLNWRGRSLTRALLWIGLAALAVADALETRDTGGPAAVANVVGAVFVGAALIGASRRAVAARVAASAAATLLLVVLVLSIALSILLVSNVEDQAVGDLDSRALQEAGNVEHAPGDAVRDAAVVRELLVQLRTDAANPASPSVLSQLDPDGEPTDAQRAQIAAELDRARGIYFDVSFAYVSQAGRVIAGGLDAGRLVPIAGSEVVRATFASGNGQGSTQLLDGAAYSVGAAPIRLRTTSGVNLPLGAVVAVLPLDRGYLEARPRGGDSLALVGRDGVASRYGPQPKAGTLRAAADGVLAGRKRVVRIADGRFTVARPVRTADQRPILALVASRSSAEVDHTRDQLFRTFFVIAFGGTVLALLLAAIVGDRIGAGIRRLTTAAEAIQLGDFRVRSGVRSEDEVGVLGATFDSMAASIEQQTDALAEAAARVEAFVSGMGEALFAVDAAG